jgi:alpha-tubulin suppressor-like RCC1 family protein
LTVSVLLPILLGACSSTEDPSNIVSSVEVLPQSASTLVGTTLQFAATPRDASGAAVPGQTVSWSSSNPSIATVDASGLATGVAQGSVTITASVDGVDGTAGLDVDVLEFSEIHAGRVSTCGLDQSGSASCWGENGQGRLGTGLGDELASSAVPLEVAGGIVFQSLSLDFNHACGVDAGRMAYCWGGGGAIGQGTGDSAIAPTAVTGGLTFGEIATGSTHSCGVADGAGANCWGYNVKGQLGDGTTTEHFAPAPLAGGLAFQAFALGSEHSCGVTTGGDTYCWGAGDVGQLGVGSPPPFQETSPQLVAGGHQFATVTAGESFACGLEAGGVAYCWGMNQFGQLGNGTMGGQSDIPVAVSGGVSFDQIDAGFNHVCGLEADGTAHCWGWNQVGRLGTGDTTSVSAPVAVNAGGLKFSQISAGDGHTCAMTLSQVAYCWGYNSDGQIGDGTRGNTRLVPTVVLGQQP